MIIIKNNSCLKIFMGLTSSSCMNVIIIISTPPNPLPYHDTLSILHTLINRLNQKIILILFVEFFLCLYIKKIHLPKFSMTLNFSVRIILSLSWLNSHTFKCSDKTPSPIIFHFLIGVILLLKLHFYSVKTQLC